MRSRALSRSESKMDAEFQTTFNRGTREEFRWGGRGGGDHGLRIGRVHEPALARKSHRWLQGARATELADAARQSTQSTGGEHIA